MALGRGNCFVQDCDVTVDFSPVICLLEYKPLCQTLPKLVPDRGVSVLKHEAGKDRET